MFALSFKMFPSFMLLFSLFKFVVFWFLFVSLLAVWSSDSCEKPEFELEIDLAEFFSLIEFFRDFFELFVLIFISWAPSWMLFLALLPVPSFFKFVISASCFSLLFVLGEGTFFKKLKK